ncbi:MAG: hypothetical protein KIT18_16255, partial [Burkholderiales bacterium]|nr:hypothetical protein [Burkholderiales bacterium]
MRPSSLRPAAVHASIGSRVACSGLSIAIASALACTSGAVLAAPQEASNEPPSGSNDTAVELDTIRV